jgi:hypothetical protein
VIINPALPDWQRTLLKKVRRKTFAKTNFKWKSSHAGVTVSTVAQDGCTSKANNVPHVHMEEPRIHLPDYFLRKGMQTIPSGFFAHETFHVFDQQRLTPEDRAELFKMLTGEEPTEMLSYWGREQAWPQAGEWGWFTGNGPMRRVGEYFAYYATFVTMTKEFRPNKFGKAPHAMTQERLDAFEVILRRIESR